MVIFLIVIPDIDVTEDSAASDVFRVIFAALATSDPWKSLLMHAVVLRNPLFAELAACCVSKVNLVTNPMLWLSVWEVMEIKERLITFKGF